MQKKNASAVPRVIPSKVEGSRGTTAGLFSGMESLASRTSSAALQPRLRFALLGMTVRNFILNFQSTPAPRVGFPVRLLLGHYVLRCIATHHFARINGAADRVNRCSI